jgi:hypothetical protein
MKSGNTRANTEKYAGWLDISHLEVQHLRSEACAHKFEQAVVNLCQRSACHVLLCFRNAIEQIARRHLQLFSASCVLSTNRNPMREFPMFENRDVNIQQQAAHMCTHTSLTGSRS